MKVIVFLSVMIFSASIFRGQQNYLDFETVDFAKLYYKSGRIDMKAKNPAPNDVNNSERCAKYTRTASELFDNIKLMLNQKPDNVILFANYEKDALKIRIKVYTSAPPGTMIEIQLAKQSDLNYPINVHSQYQAATTKQNEWEELEFNFSQKPKGSIVKTNEINQVNILFAPNTKTSEKFFFDDLIGPVLLDKNVKAVTKNNK
jgi:hypothetical protein